MILETVEMFVGEEYNLGYSFLNSLKDFAATGQSLSVGTITWTSQTPSVASFNSGSETLFTSDQGAADGFTNDAVRGRFTGVAAGRATVSVSVDAINPTATYVGVVQLLVQGIPTP